MKKATRAGGMAQVLEHLPSMLEALSSNPSTEKRERKRQQKRNVFVCVREIIYKGEKDIC
jgi:hypothetical protein